MTERVTTLIALRGVWLIAFWIQLAAAYADRSLVRLYAYLVGTTAWNLFRALVKPI